MKLNKFKTSPFWLKISVIHGINLILFVLILVLMGKLSQKAQVMKELRNQKLAAQETTKFEVMEAELETASGQIETLENAFIADGRFLNFVETMDELKSRGLISGYEPLSGNIVRSKKSTGLPVEVSLQGDASGVNRGLNSLSQVGFLFKPVTFEMSLSEDGTYLVRYGIFLYTNE